MYTSSLVWTSAPLLSRDTTVITSPDLLADINSSFYKNNQSEPWNCYVNRLYKHHSYILCILMSPGYHQKVVGIIMVLVFLTLNVQAQKGLQYLVMSMTILTLWAMRQLMGDINSVSDIHTHTGNFAEILHSSSRKGCNHGQGYCPNPSIVAQ